MKKFRFVSAVMAAAALLAGCGQKDAHVLTLGTDAERPPLAQRTGDTVAGFEIDLAEAIAQEAGKALKIVALSADKLLPALAAGKVDLVLAGLETSGEPPAEVAYSEPYYKARQMALILAGGPVPESQEELRGGRVGALAGTPGAVAAADLTAAENLRFVAAPMAAARDLMNSQLDTAILDEETAVFLAEHHPELMLIDPGYPAASYAAAVRKSDTNLLAAVNRTLAATAADGRREKLVGKWLIYEADVAEAE